MEGIATPGSQPVGRRKIVAIVLVLIAVAASLTVGAVWYFLSRTPPNTPPNGLAILANPPAGDNTTSFNFIAQVSDEQDNASKIQVRWDWENDTVWDTPWDATKSANHLFSQLGTYTVRVQAKDSGDLTADAARRVNVTHVPLRIGVVLSTTGPLSFFGVSQKDAVDMAVAEINAAGGVYGQPIQVFHGDDQTNSAVARDLATTLITTNKVVAIIGSLASGSCAAMLPVIRSARVFEIAPGCTSPTFSDSTLTGGWFARTLPPDTLQGVVGASYARNNLSFARSGVVAANSPYGAGIAAAFVNNFTRFGGAIAGGSPRYVTEFATDFTADLHAVLDVNPAPQVVYAIMNPPGAVIMMMNWWSGLGSNPSWGNVTWLFSDGAYDQTSFIDPLVSSGVDVSGFRGTVPAVYAGIAPPRYAAWATRYQTLYGVGPTLFAANAYDATFLVALAAQAAGFPTGATIRAEIRAASAPAGTVVGPNEWGLALAELGRGHDINYEGASGAVNIDARGDIIAPYVIWAVDGSNRLYTREFFSDALVASLIPPVVVSQLAAVEESAVLFPSAPRRSA